MAIKKYVKKVARRVRGKAIKRYFSKGYKPKMGRIVSDIKYLKSVLNPEKKVYQYNKTDGLLGQCNINSSAYYMTDITPVPAQGITSITRNGNSIKLHTARLKFQFQAMSNSTGNMMKCRGMVVHSVGIPFTSAATMISTMYKPNSFITGGSIYDYNSDRREDSFKQFKVIRSFDFTIPPNNHSGQTPIKNISIGVRFKNHHVKFQSDGATNIQDGQLWLIILADSGNISTTAASTLAGTGVLATNTGLFVQEDTTFWFYDN